MATIASENNKRIRKPFEVHCGFSSRPADIDAYYISSNGAKALDGNIGTSMERDWPMRKVTDLQGEGFPLDGSVEWFSVGTASEERGKLGLRTHTGGTMTLTIGLSRQAEAITLEITSGSGTVTANGVTYELQPRTVIPMRNSTQVTMVIASDDPTARVEIAGITAGVTLEFDNSNLVSCQLDLQSDLSIESPTWAESGIDLQAYYPADIESAVSNMPENTPIWYYSGYAGDYSKVRNFYLSGTVTQENGVITLSGVDASSRLNNAELDDQVLMVKATQSREVIYNKMISVIRSAGVNLSRAYESPTDVGRSTNVRPLIIREQSARDFVARIMNLGHVEAEDDVEAFWPTFVDAGIPKVTVHKPTGKWTIRESMTADHQRGFERKLSAIRTSDEYGIRSTLSKRSKRSLISETDCEKGEIYTASFDGYFIGVAVTNATVIKKTASYVTFKADRAGTCRVTGFKVYTSVLTHRLLTNQHGTTWQEDPAIYGRVYSANNDGSLNPLFPAYVTAARRSNVVGSFTFRGDPRMQPRDVFDFVRLDGTTEVCTVESIMLRHEGGGTTATLTYRKGIC